MATSHRVVFTPSGLAGRVDEGTTVLDAARRLGADLDSVCGGRGICGRCQVVPVAGSFAKWAIEATTDALTPPAPLEVDYHGSRPLLAGQRLGCSARIAGDVVIDVPAASQVHRQVVRKDLDLDPIVVDPTFSLFYVEVAPAQLGDAVSAAGMLRHAVADQHGRAVPAIDGRVLADVHTALARASGAATVAVRHRHGDGGDGGDGGDVIVAAWPGYVDTIYGVAVDIGSTTIAGHLCDLSTGAVLASAGRMNPQIRFGEDLMSRVSYVMMNPGGERELTAAVRVALDELVGELVATGGADRLRILEIVLVGNPIMHHLALGIDPTPLGSA
ncbi:MAG: 2Fe-2S iron-sulfur cluster-binding protein, partial [Ilumatobacteraceae bacterium]